MADLKSGLSTYLATGLADTATPVVDGLDKPKQDFWNGVFKSTVDLQELLGNALVLKGTSSSLASRLAVMLAPNGTIQSGTAFPLLPLPNQLFYRTDLLELFIWSPSSSAFIKANGSFFPSLELTSAAPELVLKETDQALDAQTWKLRVNSALLEFGATNFAGTVTPFMKVARTGGVPTTFEIFNPSVRVTGNSSLGTLLHANTANRNYTFPDASGKVALLDDIFRREINVQDEGVLPGPGFGITNCDNYLKIVNKVRLLGGNSVIVWPGADQPYEFSAYLNPIYNATPNLWRGVVELVDVKNCYHYGYGATVKFNMNAAWFRGNPNVASLDESVFQFRASIAPGSCDRVGVRGLNIESTATIPAGAGLGHIDGASMGIIYRGCTNTLTENPRCSKWGTDGIFFGMAYGNAFKGYGHSVINPVLIGNYRQGISIVGNDNGTIDGGEIRDTGGSSFGYAVDWEPDGAFTQSGWTVTGLKTRNNEKGAVNFINTSNVRIINPDFEELAPSSAGAIVIDGSNVPGYNVENIVFDGGRYVSNQAVLYVASLNFAGAGITNIRFTGGAYLSCIGNAPNNSAFLRLNPFSAGLGYLGDFYLEDCVVDGNGGLRVGSGATGKARVFMKNMKWNLRNPAGVPLAFSISSPTTFELNMDGVEQTISAGNTLAPTNMFIDSGSLRNCKMSGHAGATLKWIDKTPGAIFKIGYNEFSANNFYDGPTAGLILNFPGCVQLDRLSGDFGIPFRILHGGRRRVEDYIANPALFTGEQAPRDGDITTSLGNSGGTISNEVFVFDDTLGWRQIAAQTFRGTTAQRPAVALAPLANIGLLYIDNTLGANGKPIWWNGAAWVDAVGTVV